MPLQNHWTELLKPTAKGGLGVSVARDLFTPPKYTISLFDRPREMTRLDSNIFFKGFTGLFGSSGSGKSHAAGLLMEALLEVGAPVFIADISGEHTGVVTIFETQFVRVDLHNTIDINIYAQEIAKQSVEERKSVYADLSDISRTKYLEFLDVFLWESFNLKTKIPVESRVPHLYFLEEAHNYVPQWTPSYDQKNVHAARVREIILKIALEGRKYGVRMVLLSQRPALLDTNTISQTTVRILLRVADPNDVKAYLAVLPGFSFRTLAAALHKFIAGDAYFVMPGVRCKVHLKKKKRSPDLAPTPDAAKLAGYEEGKGLVKNS
jgi:hypothetical protein